MDGRELAAREHPLPVHALLDHLGAQLRPDGTAEGVGGKVAKEPACPVRVLQGTLSVAVDVDPQVFLVLCVPDAGYVPRDALAGKEQLLYLVAYEYVDRVAELVGLGAHGRSLGTVGRKMELVGRHTAELTLEVIGHDPDQWTCEGAGASYVVLEEARLALVHARGGAALERAVVVVGVDAQLVEGVAPLVQHREHVRDDVLGVDVGGDDAVVGMVVVNKPDEESIMVVSENGYGKRSQVEEYRVTNRGAKGVKTLNITEKTGRLVAIKNVNDENDLMIINKSGITIRLAVSECRVMGRNTQGVRLINLSKKNDVIASVCKVMSSELEALAEQKSREAFAQSNEAFRNETGIAGDTTVSDDERANLPIDDENENITSIDFEEPENDNQ